MVTVMGEGVVGRSDGTSYSVTDDSVKGQTAKVRTSYISYCKYLYIVL